MKLYFMKQKSLDMLRQDISNNVEKYQSKEKWIDDYYNFKGKPIYYFDTGIEVEDYQLVIGKAETDFQNSKIIYEALSKYINPVQASDLRLWAYLAHVKNWEYMCTRWGIDAYDDENEVLENEKKSSQEKIIDRIGSRYFFEASKGKAFVRQGIARLYWGAYLTYDDDNEDPYEYTKFFFSKQDVFTSITERSYARNKTLVLAILRELKKNPNLSREKIRLYLAKVNQSGAITMLDSLNKKQADDFCVKIMNEIQNEAVLKEGSTFKAINKLTGKAYGPILTIEAGFVMALGKKIKIKPKNLIGQKEGTLVTISGKQYIIKNVQ